ncbi:MAG TPA: AI-2E family transporter [Thermomicrobiales bacterium]|nr:AI-2E family transporter [Thermomicrobiales bacterium]
MSPQPSLSRVIVSTIAVLAIVGLAWVILQIRSILVLLALGIIFAAAIEPLVFRLRRAGLRRGQAIMVVYLALFAVIGFALYIIVPLLVHQVTAFDAAVPDIFENLRQQALNNHNNLIRQQGYRALLRIEETYHRVRNSPEIGQDQAVGVVTSAFGVIFTIISLMIVAFYWMTEKATVKRVILGLFPFSRRARAHAIWDEIEYRIGGWTRGQLILMLVIGTLSGIFYYAIDLRFWLALAIFAGLTEAVPFIGPIIGGGVAALIALADSPEKALLVIVFATLLQQLEGAFLVPRIMKNAVGMNPLTVVLAVLIGGVLAGPLGALLAIPIGAACQVLVGNLLRLRDDFIASELRTLDVAPLSSRHFDTPFEPPSKRQASLQRQPEALAEAAHEALDAHPGPGR